MMYYGPNRLFLNHIRSSKRTTNYFFRSVGVRTWKKHNLNSTILTFYLPPLWEFINIFNKITSQRSFYFYTNSYYFILPHSFLIEHIKYNSTARSFYFAHRYVNNFYFLFWNYFKFLFISFSFFFFRKLKFRGKGYYIFKNKRNTVTFRFGYSHRIYLYFYGTFVKFLSKTSIFIYGINKNDIINYGHTLKNVRPYNLFTGKGVRFTRQILYKKVGKVGSYR